MKPLIALIFATLAFHVPATASETVEGAKKDYQAAKAEVAAQLEAGGVRVVTTPVKRLVAKDHELERIELTDGSSVPCGALFAHPKQRQVEVVNRLGVALDDDGFVRTDAMTRETSVKGIYAAGDLTTRMQGAIFSAAAGMHAAAMVNLDLTMERPL